MANEVTTVDSETVVIKDRTEAAEKPKKGSSGENDQLMGILKELAGSMSEISERMGKMESRVRKIEGGDREAFKYEAKDEDIASAEATREKVDPKVISIVNEILGVDFGIEMAGRQDSPGWLFTLVVPERLSDNAIEKRPILNPERPGEYKKDPFGQVEFEDYRPEDRRTRAISDADAYGAIKEHCERVRNHIVAFYQTSNKPLPPFKVK